MDVKKVVGTSGRMTTEKVQVVWRIENFTRIRTVKVLRDRQKLRFQAGSTIGLASDWVCSLFQRQKLMKTLEGRREWKKFGYVHVGLERIPAGVQELVASLKVKTQTGVGVNRALTTAIENETGATNLVRTCAWGLLKRRFGLIMGDLWKCPLIDGSLIIEMELTIMKMEDVIPRPRQRNQQKIEDLFKPKFTEKPQQDLGKLLKSHGQTDAKILTKDDVEFEVHRCILSERSPVFATMFQTPMTETQTGIVDIPDLSSKTMAVLLRYIYAGTLHQDWSEELVLPELVYAANKYELQDLVDFLDQVVGRVCSKKNAGRLLGLLGKVGMRKGEREVLAFIKSHMKSFEDLAKFAVEGVQQPDIKSQKSGTLKLLLGSLVSSKQPPSQGNEKKVSPSEC